MKALPILMLMFVFGCSGNKEHSKPQIFPKLTKEQYNRQAGTTPKDAVYTQAPIIERKYPPVIPNEAKDKELTGTVVLDVEILTSGQVGMVEVAESTGYPILDEAAVKAAKTWRFSPALNEGTPVSVWARFPIEFK